MNMHAGKGKGFGHSNRKTQGLDGVSLNALALSGLLTNGLANSWSGLINNATSGSTITKNQTGLTVTSASRAYTWDGTGTAGTTSNGLVETLGAVTANSVTTVLPAATGPLKPSGRQFFTNTPMMAMIIPQSYASTAILSATSDDGTTLTVGTNSQGYPLITGTYTTPGVKTITITDTGPAPVASSTHGIYVSAPPTVPSNAIASATATRINNSYNAKIPITVGGSPPTITINTGNSTVNGRTLVAGGSTANASVPDGSGVGGSVTQTVAAGAYIYADTSLGTATGGLTWAPGMSKRWVFTGTIGTTFDFKISGSGAFGQTEVTILWTDDADSANPTWYKQAATPYVFKTVVSYFTVTFPSAPPGAGKRAVEVVLGQGVAMTGFNFEASATIGPYTKTAELKVAAWNDSYDFGQSNINQSFGNSVRVAGEYLGSHYGVSHGHRTNAWARIGGTQGKHGYVPDRIASNPYALDEITRWGALDIAFFHMSINDNSLSNFTTNTAPTSIFNNAGGSGSFVQGPTTLYNMLVNAFWRARLASPSTMIVVDIGFHNPGSTPTASILSAYRNAFAAAFASDKLAIMLDFNAALYRYMGSTYAISGMSAPAIPAGADGSSSYFGTVPATITYSITGSVLTVTAANAGDLREGMTVGGGADGSSGTCQIQSQLTGTAGGTGTYQLTFAPGDVASTSASWKSDAVHPLSTGHTYWGQERAKAALFCAQKVLGLI